MQRGCRSGKTKQGQATKQATEAYVQVACSLRVWRTFTASMEETRISTSSPSPKWHVKVLV